ncbi:MAG: hypothetical protein ROZ00_13245 [Denitratisoma sp.]|nr:hypothetical protein [Denitratisoma sp.]
MRLPSLLSLACLLATSGCLTTTPVGTGSQATPAEPAAARSRPADAAATAPQPAPVAKDRAPVAAAPAGPQPDAIIKLNPGSDRLTGEMEARLAAIAAKAREDARVMLRLESYVPDGGSPSLNLVRAEQSLQLIKKRLVDLDVSPRRIFLAPFGEEYATARDERRYWVEIYLIKPRL